MNLASAARMSSDTARSFTIRASSTIPLSSGSVCDPAALIRLVEKLGPAHEPIERVLERAGHAVGIFGAGNQQSIRPGDRRPKGHGGRRQVVLEVRTEVRQFAQPVVQDDRHCGRGEAGGGAEQGGVRGRRAKAAGEREKLHAGRYIQFNREGPMKASAAFKPIKWDETTLDQISSDVKTTRASVTFAFSGALDGQAAVEYLMFYSYVDAKDPHGSRARYVGLLRVTGRLNGVPGTFVMEEGGTFEKGAATSALTILEGSGTGDLAGIRGTGRLASTKDGASCELDYDV